MAARPTPHVGTPSAFIVERYWPGATDQGLAEAADAVRRAALVLSAEGRFVRLVDAFVARADQVAFTLLEADSKGTVREASERAGLPFDRITQVDRPQHRGAAGTGCEGG